MGSIGRPSDAPSFTRVFEQCVQSCDRALARYARGAGVGTGSDVVQHVVRAMAAVATAGEYLHADPHRRALALRLAVDSCERAADCCRRHGLDRDLLLCAAACDRAAAQAARALESPAA